MLRTLRLLFQLIVLIGFAIGCSNDDSGTIPKETDGPISVESAKKYYDNHLNNDKKWDSTRTVFWEYAKVRKLYEGQDVVAIPVTQVTSSNKISIRQLWIYKTTSGSTTSMVVEYIRENPHTPTLDNFTGLMIARDWDNNYKLGLTYKSGIITGAIKEIKSDELEIDSKKLKTNAYAHCGPGIKCIPVRGAVPTAIPDQYWSWSCYEIFDCLWIEEAGMPSPPADIIASYSFSIGGSDLPGPDLYAFRFDKLQDKCAGMGTLFSRSDSKNMEHGAVITKTGKMIVLPTFGNTTTSMIWGPQRYDLNGRLITDIHVDNLGKYVIRLYDYSVNPANPHIETHEIEGLVHTHPCGPSYPDYNKPSSIDKSTASQFPGINHYIKHCFGVTKYNSDGVLYDRAALAGCAPE